MLLINLLLENEFILKEREEEKKKKKVTERKVRN